jgi:hypothetical protein
MRRPFSSGKIIGAAAVLAVAFLWSSSFFFPTWWSLSYHSPAAILSDNLTASSTSVALGAAPVIPSVVHLPTPEAVKALYMTQCAAATPSFRDHLLKLADETEVNSIVVDLKDYSGTFIFPSETAIAGGRGCTYDSFADLVKVFHEHDIYVIGRLTVFQDPLYTKTYPEQAVQSAAGGVWKDHKGLAFVDVSSRAYWDYVIKLSREAYELGVDEINFDYVRYPSDGNMKDARYVVSGKPHAENLELFFKTLAETLRAEIPKLVLSADLFGMVTTNYDDLNIGQVLERALPYFDYIGPMVYPSHYPKTFNGWADPNAYPYELIHFVLSTAVERTEATTTKIASLAYERIGTSTPAIYAKPAYNRAKIRPWLQDFDYPVPYTPEMVRAQIKATYDAGLDSWMMWDPANKYTPSALNKEENGI